MADRMIPCPKCGGTSVTLNGRGIAVDCFMCNASPGTIPDRRAPSASDRAVERILAEDEAQGSGRYADRYTQGYGDGVEHCAVIIHEEAERDA